MGLPFSPADFRLRLLPIALAQGIGLACGLAGVHVTTKWIQPEALGRYALFLTLAPLGMLVFHAGLARYLARHWALAQDRRALARAIAARAWRRAPWLALTLIVAAWFTGADRPWVLAAAALPAALLMSWLTFSLTSLQALRAHWEDCAASAVGSVLRSFLPPLLYVLSGGRGGALLAGFVLYAAGTASLYALFARRHLGPTGSPGPTPLPDSSVYDGRLFLAVAASQWVLQGVGRWTAHGAFGSAFTGYFSLASNIALIATTMLGSIFLQYLQPRLFTASWDSAGARLLLVRQLDRVAFAVTGLALAGLVVLQWATPFLVGVWIDDKYLDALPWIMPTGCFALAGVLGQIFQLGFLAAHRERDSAPVDLSLSLFLIAGTVAFGALQEPGWWKIWFYAAPLWPWLYSRFRLRRILLREVVP